MILKDTSAALIQRRSFPCSSGAAELLLGFLPAWTGFGSPWFDQFAKSDWAARLTAHLSAMPPAVLVGLLIVPLALALASRRISIVIVVLLLAGLAWFTIFKSPVFDTLAAPIIYVASVMMALAELVVARRRNRMNAELAALRADVVRLHVAEQRRFIVDLKSSTKNAQETESNAADRSR